jgi:hypothetical protein
LEAAPSTVVAAGHPVRRRHCVWQVIMRRTRELLYQTETTKLELLSTPIHALDLSMKDAIFGQAIPVVREELRRAGLTKLDPIFYISTGYGCIAGQPLIALGFYDFHPLLKDLNQEYRGWRYSDADIFDLLRHECGHAFCYSYKLYRRRDFRELFDVHGNFFNTYPDKDKFTYNPWSRDYVNPNGDHYAQKHPDEDFAESFTVWLTPRSHWKSVYKRYPRALRKLQYVDKIVKELGRKPPEVEINENWMLEPYGDIKQTVAQFMKAKPQRYYTKATGYVDPDLRDIFRQQPRVAKRSQLFRDFLRADAFIKAQKQALSTRVAYWVGVDPIVVTDLVEKLTTRARALNLWVDRTQHEKKLLELTSYVSVLCANYKSLGTYLR